jgi:hypothetical protein
MLAIKTPPPPENQMRNLTMQTTEASVTARSPQPNLQVGTIAACSIGNALEMYDFTVYSFFAMLMCKLSFPSDSAYRSLPLPSVRSVSAS